jgi:hypothetical protein
LDSARQGRQSIEAFVGGVLVEGQNVGHPEATCALEAGPIDNADVST